MTREAFAVKYRSLRRFLTLFAACVVSLCAAAYLSFEAASRQEGVSGEVALASGDSETPKFEAPGAVDPAPVASIAPPAATQIAAAKAAAESAAEDATLLRVSLHPDSDPDLPLALAYGAAGAATPDLHSSAAASAPAPEASLPEAAKPVQAAQPERAAQSESAAQPEKAAQPQNAVTLQQAAILPLPPLQPPFFGPGKSVPLPPVRPASLSAAVTPLPPVNVAVANAAPVVDPAAPAAAAAPSAAHAVAPSAASQVPVPAPARVEARLEAPNALPAFGDALAAVTASVGGGNAALASAQRPATPAVAPSSGPADIAVPAAPEPTGGFKMGQQVFVRIFKQEGTLELWMKRGERFALYKSFAVCKWSGALGPKTRAADYQSPEGFYSVSARQLNPHSHYHLAFDVGYPNAYDRRQGFTGSAVMVHGDCKSVGCFAMTNAGIDEIYPIVAAALAGGQHEVPVHIFPFRMTEQAIARETTSSSNSFLAFLDNGGGPKRDWGAFWRNLKQGYDLFEHDRAPPVAYACGDRYEFGAAGRACARIAGW
jgi:murein L,D-transpeptidase YafK